jgi:alpha-D-ribose 1-methylphosphonate 5-triphosphate synthase subunit PhnI
MIVGMRLRVEPAAAREQLAEQIRGLGGQVIAVGSILDMAYAAEDLVDANQGSLELMFFVRAWLSAQPEAVAEMLA